MTPRPKFSPSRSPMDERYSRIWDTVYAAEFREFFTGNESNHAAAAQRAAEAADRAVERLLQLEEGR